MKSLDFSFVGKMPGGQDRLNYLQTAWTEALVGLAAMGGDTTGPFVISGCAFTRTSLTGTFANWSVSSGWICYNGELVQVVGGGPDTMDESLSAPYLSLVRTSLPLVYDSGASHNVINDVTANIITQPIGTPNSATLIAVSSIKPFGREAAETHAAVATGAGAGTIGGDIYYRKNFLNNTLQLRGQLLTTTPSDFAAWPHVSTIPIGTLPAGYAPKSFRVAFNANGPKGEDALKDANGTYFTRLNGCVGTDGIITIDWLKPDAGLTIYGMEFNFIMSLD